MRAIDRSHLKGLLKGRFSEEGLGAYAMVVGAYMVVYVSSYVYAVVIARLLGPSDYSAVASLLAFGTIISVGAGGPLQSIVARYVSADTGAGAQENARYLVKRALLLALIFGAVVLLIGAVLSWPVKQWLGISTLAPVLLMALYTGVWLIHPVMAGTVQGVQKFKVLSLGFVLGAVTRVVAGIVLVVIGLKVMGAMVAEVLSAAVVVFILGEWVIRWLRAGPAEGKIDIAHLKKFAPSVIISSTCLISFIYMDVFLVRGLIGGAQSGYYAAAQKLGTAMYFIPGIIAVVLFPRVSASYAGGTTSWRLFWRAQAIVALLCGATAVFFAAFPDWCMRVVFGSKYVPGASLVRVFALAMFCFSMLPICSQFLLATDRYRFVYILAAGVTVEAVGILFFHSSVAQVAWVVALASVATLVSMAAYISIEWMRWRREQAGGQVREAGSVQEPEPSAGFDALFR